MTYLLTEVALGILGYNFYDIDGVPGSPCLSESVHIPLEEAEYRTRPHLVELMKSDLKTVQECAKVYCNGNGNVMQLQCSTPEDQISSKINQHASGISGSLGSKEKKLIKLFNFGRAKLREQIRRHKSEFVFKPCPLEKDFAKVVAAFKQEERLKLKQELKVLSEFRKSTENAVKSLDEDLFNKYTNTFQISGQKIASTTLAPDSLSLDK